MANWGKNVMKPPSHSEITERLKYTEVRVYNAKN